jgi:hypothetical protein
MRRCSVAEITIPQAIERLTKEVEKHLPPDEIHEIYHELFPRGPVDRSDHSPEATKRRLEQLVAYFHGDRFVEEFVHLWGLIFTTHRDIWYNEEDEVLHYCDEEAAYSTEGEPESK